VEQPDRTEREGTKRSLAELLALNWTFLCRHQPCFQHFKDQFLFVWVARKEATFEQLQHNSGDCESHVTNSERLWK